MQRHLQNCGTKFDPRAIEVGDRKKLGIFPKRFTLRIINQDYKDIQVGNLSGKTFLQTRPPANLSLMTTLIMINDQSCSTSFSSVLSRP